MKKDKIAGPKKNVIKSSQASDLRKREKKQKEKKVKQIFAVTKVSRSSADTGDEKKEQVRADLSENIIDLCKDKQTAEKERKQQDVGERRKIKKTK